jgi:hypothetical protein
MEVSLVMLQSAFRREVLAAQVASLLDAVHGHQVAPQARVVPERLAAHGAHVRAGASVGHVMVLGIDFTKIHFGPKNFDKFTPVNSRCKLIREC